jgi:hypothetical protein
MNTTRAASGLVVAMLGLTSGIASAVAQDGLGPLVQVSDVSPFGALEDCGNFPGEFFGIGVNFVDSEVEPWVEVNPTRPSPTRWHSAAGTGSQ